MEIIKKDILVDGTVIHIEDWSTDYDFYYYGTLLVAYPKSKKSLNGQFSPKENKTFRCEFTFNSYQEAEQAFNDLTSGNKTLCAYKEQMREKKYSECI